jgi:hypothetical protein
MWRFVPYREKECVNIRKFAWEGYLMFFHQLGLTHLSQGRPLMTNSVSACMMLCVSCSQRGQRGVAPTDCWNWGEWRLKEYKWLVRLARHASTKDFFPALAALASSVQNIFFLAVHYFDLCVSIRPATWVGSRAGSPVSECVCPAAIVPVSVNFILISCLSAPFLVLNMVSIFVHKLRPNFPT